MIREAAAGEASARDRFVQSYRAVLETYLRARWRGSARLLDHVDDAIQDIFVECLRHDGVLARAEHGRDGGFRAFLYGLARNIARRHEDTRVTRGDSALTVEPPADDTSLSQVFDRAWARTIMQHAAALLRARALDEPTRRAVELLRLRFQEGLQIRDIAALWDADPARVHQEFRTARAQFYRALREVVAFHSSAEGRDLDAECEALLGLLGAGR